MCGGWILVPSQIFLAIVAWMHDMGYDVQRCGDTPNLEDNSNGTAIRSWR